jgi:2-C-methyl-D-erythritol 2,4-cyclodiphosphate synthase
VSRKSWAEVGGRIINIDSTLIAEEPRIGPFVPEMRASIGRSLNLAVTRIGVKATTNESLGFLGRGEGIAAMATASVEMPEE